MALSLQVIYPNTPGTSFDMEYYLDTHMSLVDKHMGPHLASSLVTRGVPGGPDTPPPFHAIATFTFADKAAMEAAMSSSQPLLADIPNFTDTAPQMLIGEVVA